MQLSNALSLLFHIFHLFSFALVPTLKAIYARPILLLQPTEVSDLFMSHVWNAMADGIDENGKDAKRKLIEPHAKGVVLDIGAGHGHTVDYLDKTRVTRYIALEPNPHMLEKIKVRAQKAGFTESDGSLIILGCGAEDINFIIDSLRDTGHDGTVHRVDTIVSVLTLCSVPDPKKTIKRLVGEVLKDGGELLYYEHVRSPWADVAWWQTFWTPVWSMVFGGCKLDRPTDKVIAQLRISGAEKGGNEKDGLSMWSESKQWGDENDLREHMFWHAAGRFVKA